MRVGGGVIAALAGLVSAAAVAAQSFDVATVKRTPPEATGVEQPSIVQFQPQAFRRTNSTLRTIVRTAYNVQDYQGKRSMAQLAQYLGSIVGRPVVDRTGVTGNFEMSLTFAPDLRDTERPSIFVALPEQMGVRLEPARGAIETIAIESASLPSAN